MTRQPTDLKTVTSLNALRGHIKALHAGNFLHLFSAEKKIQVLRLLVALMSKQSGTIIFGSHRAATAERTAANSDGQWQTAEEFEATAIKAIGSDSFEIQTRIKENVPHVDQEFRKVIYWSIERR